MNAILIGALIFVTAAWIQAEVTSHRRKHLLARAIKGWRETEAMLRPLLRREKLLASAVRRRREGSVTS